MIEYALAKLSSRLNHIREMVPEHTYDVIWDCCCDHGLLGLSLMNSNSTRTVKFVDVVPTIMEQLNKQLSVHAPEYIEWSTLCEDVSTLQLLPTQDRHLVLLAGVGGELSARFIEQILTNNPTVTIDFLLCPVRDLFMLRKTLIKKQLALLDEKLVTDNNRIYEILYVSTRAQEKTISPVGEKIWQTNTLESQQIAKHYLAMLTKHYERAANRSAIAAEALNLYRGVNVFSD
ncbi:class I SAM-dependent methyltransferase [Pseudoalteromonas xiamenensis]|uniref:tRNA (adenine(22)-N(1))-methyltransferase n=1 Tax=Pseudoalteromonas xiamenensis TaxID=882626 RepID=UPI0027E461BE|nr:tRNA (adenine(22)-N(1))-methyltransferase TrmK [Pseudoalteromonas xiamenensis]WMN61418.1 class I SAM-dependent methyltransferase [Pseudoalteromonas xiamenensis]